MTLADASIEDIFNSCLSTVESGRETIDEAVARYPEQADELRPLLETAVWFGRHKALVAPRPGFVSASKGRLISEIKQAQAAAPAQASWLERTFGGRSWRLGLQLALVLALLVCLVLGSSGIAYASQGALPGDGLYPVKTGLEQVRLSLTPDDAGQIRLHMHFAQLRLAEMQQLLDLGRYGDIRIATDNYRQHIQMATLLLGRLALTNPAQARLLAAEMSLALQGHIILLDAMASAAPPAAQVQLEAARLAAAFNLSIVHNTQDRLGTRAAPTPTITPTPSATATPSATPTPLPSETPTQEPTATPTLAVTLTPTPTPSPSRTSSVTPTRSLTATRTLTPTATRTPTPTRTPGGVTLTPTRTRTNTPKPGITLSRTPTPVTPSRTPQADHTPSATPRPDTTPSPTQNPGPTSTYTPRPPTSTPTRPPTHTPEPTSPVPPTPPPGPSPYPPPVYPPPGY